MTVKVYRDAVGSCQAVRCVSKIPYSVASESCMRAPQTRSVILLDDRALTCLMEENARQTGGTRTISSFLILTGLTSHLSALRVIPKRLVPLRSHVLVELELAFSPPHLRRLAYLRPTPAFTYASLSPIS